MTKMYFQKNEESPLYFFLFNKKKLIKVLNYFGISDWRYFLKNIYTSDDTEAVAEEFLLRGWHYKEVLVEG